MGIDRTQLRLNAFNRKRVRFGEDLCDLIGPTQVAQGSGHTITDTTLASDIPCYVEQSSGTAQPDSDAVNRTTLHRITMEGTDEARLINQHYKIKVLARDNNPEMVFEQPVREIQSFSSLVVVNAVYTVGYRQPGTR